MNEKDAQLVLELFRNEYIQILVAPYDLCWSLDISVHLVVVMGEEWFSSLTYRYLLL